MKKKVNWQMSSIKANGKWQINEIQINMKLNGNKSTFRLIAKCGSRCGWERSKDVF